MAEHIFSGSAVAIVTPMNNDGSINYDEYGKLIDFQINNGTDAIVACGTTGESATMSKEEHCQVIEYTVKKVAKRVPVIAGTGSNDTVFAAELSAEAEERAAVIDDEPEEAGFAVAAFAAGEEEEEGSSLSTILMILGLALAAGLILVVIYRRRKEQQEAAGGAADPEVSGPADGPQDPGTL